MGQVAGAPLAGSEVLALFPRLDAQQAAVAIAIYRGIAGDGRVPVEALAERLDRPASLIRDWLAEVPAVYFDDEGAIRGFWGFTAEPVSPHRMWINGALRYAWCAWDALFIPHLLGQRAAVASRCPVTGAPIRLAVDIDHVESLQPDDAVVSLRVPREDEFTSDVLGSFCHHVFFFASREAGQQWAEGGTDIRLITVQEALDLGLEKNRRQFGP